MDSNQCGSGYETIDSFKSATGYETHGLAITGGLDPFRVNAQAGDFRLKEGSTAIGRGTPLPPDIASAIGLPPGTGVDLGALQPQAVFISQAKTARAQPRRNSNWFGALALEQIVEVVGH